MPKQVTYIIDSIADGIATNDFGGGKHQVAPGTGATRGTTCIRFDIRPGIVEPVIALQRDIGNPATRTVGGVYKASDGTFYWIGKTAGNVLQMYTGAPGSSTTLSASGATAAVNSSGAPMVEFDDFLFFYDTATDLAKYNIGTPAITLQANSAALTGNVSNHLLVYKSFLFYCNKNKVGRATSNTAYNDAALTLETRYRVQALVGWDKYILVCCSTQNEGGNSRIFVWDGVSTNYDYSFDIPSTGLRAAVNNGGIVYFFSSNNTNGNSIEPNKILIFRWSGGSQVQQVKEIDLAATSTNSVTINPWAVTASRGKIFFSISASTANTMKLSNGVYSLDDRGALNLEYIDESGTITDIDGSFVKWIDGRLFFFFTDSSSNYRVLHQYSQTYSSSGRVKTIALKLDPRYETRIDEIFFRVKSLPASTAIVGYIDTDQTGSITEFHRITATAAKAFYAINQQNSASYSFQPGHEHEIYIDFSVSGSTRPEIILPIYIKATVFDNQQTSS